MIISWISPESNVPDDGIEVLAWSDQESNHYSKENEGHFELVYREEGFWYTAEEGIMIERNIDLWAFVHTPKLT